MSCPCCSQKSFSDCCEPYLSGARYAESPEQLMRSRYTAYTRADINYIQKTMRKDEAKNYDPVATKMWASSVRWLGLTILDTPSFSEQRGTVTFFARFFENDVKKYIFEKSDFEKIDGMWYYIDGATPTIGRNDPCPCGSRKKFKKCCQCCRSSR